MRTSPSWSTVTVRRKSESRDSWGDGDVDLDGRGEIWPWHPVENETAAVFDLTDQSTIAPLLSGCDGVTHLAGIPVDDASTILGDDVRPPADVPQAGDMASAEFTLRFL